jgi:LPS export ABC transporter protein LptC
MPSGPATFTTEFLRIIPKLSRAETDRAVTIEEPRGIIHGVGMVLDNDAHTFKLKSAVRGTLQPRPLPK